MDPGWWSHMRLPCPPSAGCTRLWICGFVQVVTRKRDPDDVRIWKLDDKDCIIIIIIIICNSSNQLIDTNLF